MNELLFPVADPRITPHGCAAWRHLDIRIATTTAGRFISPPRSNPRLMIHLGPPARVTSRLDDRSKTALQTRGALHVIPAESGVVWDDEDPTTTMSIWLAAPLLAAAGHGMAPAARRTRLGPRFNLHDDQLFRLALLLKAEVEAGQASDPLFAESLGLALATRMLGRYGAMDPVGRGSTLSKPRLRLVLDYIEAHLEGEIQLIELASLVHLSPSHFRTLFARSTGQSVHQYVIARRVARARELLETGTMTVAQVAAHSGFCHQSHLARSMRQVLGVTPSQLGRRCAA